MEFDIFFLLFVYLILVGCYVNKRRKVTKTTLLCLGPVLVQALRSPVCGLDVWRNGFGGYYQSYSEINAIPLKSIFTAEVHSYEQGYVIYNKLLSFISDNPQFLLAATSIIIFSLIGYIYYKYSENVFLSTIIFVCFGLYVFSFSGLRQAIAFSITFFSFRFIIKRQLVHFLVSVFIAFTIHSSAIIFVFVWPLWNIRHTNKLSLILLAVTIFALPFYSMIFSFIVPLLFREKYLIYMNGTTAINLLLIYVFIYILPILLKTNDFSISDDQYKDDLKYKIENFIRWMAYFSFLFQSLGTLGGDSITRIAFYFSVFLPLYIPLIFKKAKLGNRDMIYTCITLLFIAFFYYDSAPENYNIIPYKFFWELF